MKKIFLLSIASAMTALSASAQEFMTVQQKNSLPVSPTTTNPLSGGKVTATGDTLYFLNNPQKAVDSLMLNLVGDRTLTPPLDSGYFFGISPSLVTGVAEGYRYGAINKDATPDTTYRIIGIVSRWSGHCATSNSTNINFTIWDKNTTKTAISGLTKAYVYGYPNNSKASKTVTAGTVVAASITNKNSQVTYLTSPLTGINYDVYVGYTMASYTWGSTGTDTFGLKATRGMLNPHIDVESSTKDTLVFADGMFQISGTWKANYWQGGAAVDAVIYPIIQRECGNCFPSSVSGITNRGLTFIGNYPNPAVNSTNIQFGLDENADVKIDVMDNSGRLINTITKSNLSKGNNIVTIETTNLPAGNYVYLIEASNGGHFASQFTVAK